MTNNVIFDTAICSSNLGDEIILSAIYDHMGDIFSEGNQMRLGTHVANFTRFQMLTRDFKSVYCRNADRKFICGTNIISQKRVGRINPQWKIFNYNLPIYRDSIMVGVGMTETKGDFDWYTRNIYKKVLSKKYYHSARDEQTKSMIESLGAKAINTGCPTLWGLTPEHCSKIPQEKSENCIFTVSGYTPQRDPALDQRMLDVLKDNYKTLYAWIQTTEDEKYLNTLNVDSNIKKIYSLSEYKKVLQTKKVDYVGTRLHGGVYALQNGARTIVISIDHRARGFKVSNNLMIVERDDIESLDAIINSKFETSIILNSAAIEEFKNQFKH